MKKFIESYLSAIKAVLFVLFAVIAVFVDVERPFSYWGWWLFVVLALVLIGLEIYQHQKDKAAPLTKLRTYLLDHDGWEKTGMKDYYIADPVFTISPIEEEAPHLDYQQEWTRGEIGYHYTTGNTAYYAGAFMNGLLLQKIHIVVFDGGKKIAVAPSWDAIGRGRFYYYLEDSIEYAYQRYLAQERGEDHSRGISKSGVGGTLDIPVLKGSKELQEFIAYCDEPICDPATENSEQTEIFYGLLEKYQAFKKVRRS